VYAEAQRPQESFRLVTECLVEAGGDDLTLDVRIRFLQLIRQRNQSSSQMAAGSQSLTDPSLGWEEAVERNWEQEDLRLSDLVERPLALTLDLDNSGLPEEQGAESPQNLQAVLTLRVELLQDGARKIHLELQNESRLPSGAQAKRDEALPRSFVSAHVLLGLRAGQFVSLLDPGQIYRDSATACSNVGVFPVLAGEEPDRSMMLCSPIILYDYPKIAPESAGDFFDGTEMDEMLTLRVLTLTDAEKQEMRDGDPRARRILERTEALSGESLMKAHGAIRGMREIREDAQ
jgi:hypothetical protein